MLVLATENQLTYLLASPRPQSRLGGRWRTEMREFYLLWIGRNH